MQLTNKHHQVFESFSHDRNPMHGDADYSRRTPYGVPIAHGISGVFLALASWLKGKRVVLQDIQVTFKKPFFFGASYDVFVDDVDGGAKIRCEAGGVSYCDIKVKALSVQAQAPAAFHRSFLPLLKSQPAPTVAQSVGDSAYEIQESVWAEFCDTFRWEKESLPLSQVRALAWTSYFVGMVFPGQQALYSSLRMEFTESTEMPFQVRVDEIKEDPRFQRYSILGSATGVKRFQIDAFQRPEPVTYSPSDIQKTGKSVAPWDPAHHNVVTGASRGLGSVLALALGSRQPKLLFQYLSDEAGSERLQTELAALGCQASKVRADLTKASGRDALAQSLALMPPGPLRFFHCAAPAAWPVSMKEQSGEQMVSAVVKGLSMGAHALETFLKYAGPGSVFVNVSTVYVVKPVAGFGDYIAYKSAFESLVKTAALENPELGFVTVRFPKILTDQTNLSFYVGEKPQSPVELAWRLLASPSLKEKGYSELSLWEPA